MPKFIAIATFEADDIDDARNKFCAIGYKHILEGVSGKSIAGGPKDVPDFLEHDMPDIIRYTMDEWPREVVIKRAEGARVISLKFK